MSTEAAALLTDRVMGILKRHACPGETERWGHEPITGAFGLYPNADEPDLYGMIDAVYCLYMIGRLEACTDRASRRIWADRILGCQDNDGWFTRRNLRGHGREHATAYAVGALKLLELGERDSHLTGIRPISGIRPILQDRAALTEWLKRLGYEGWKGILRKNVGWQHVWRSSHLAGVPATLLMLEDLPKKWWPTFQLDVWFEWLFDWLDAEVNPETGLWQRAVWNRLYKRPTLIDLGGAAHFHWLYVAADRPIPYPDQVITSVIHLQNPSGLYSDHPYCIDLDANFCIARSFNQLPPDRRGRVAASVASALRRNVEGIRRYLVESDTSDIYENLHDLPGALAAIVEPRVTGEIHPAVAPLEWRNVFERVAWL